MRHCKFKNDIQRNFLKFLFAGNEPFYIGIYSALWIRLDNWQLPAWLLTHTEIIWEVISEAVYYALQDYGNKCGDKS